MSGSSSSRAASRLLEHPGALCNMVRRIALAAGAITLDYFDDAGCDADRKSDGSPVTIADRKAEEYITKALRDILPAVPVVGEEAVAAGHVPDLSQSPYFWLVDPLDGTKEFISGSGEYTVNIALIKNGEPILGVVYAPVPGELYAGHGPGTAIRYMDDTETERKIRVRPLPRGGMTVVASRSHGSGSRMDEFLAHYMVARLIKRGSSLKICAIAAGKADMYPRFGPTCEWDTAAGDAVLRAAGGTLTDTANRALRYGGSHKKFVNPEFIARSAECVLPDDPSTLTP